MTPTRSSETRRRNSASLAGAIVAYAADRGVTAPATSGFRNVPGHGAVADVDGHRVVVGNRKLMAQEGVELAKNSILSGQPGSRRVIRDRLGRVVEDVGATREPHHGSDLALSIDSKVQYLAFNAVHEAVVEHRARAGA